MVGMGRKVNSPVVHRTLSFTVLLLRSISPTCSLATVMLTCKKGTYSFTASPFLSIRAKLTINPPRAYNINYFFRCLARNLGFLFWYTLCWSELYLSQKSHQKKYLIDEHDICRISHHLVHFVKLSGNSHPLLFDSEHLSIPGGHPRILGQFGPKVIGAFDTSDAAIRIFRRPFSLRLTISLNLLSGGCPILRCTVRAR